MVTRYVNNPNATPNYVYYADAVNASSDGDTIKVYNNNVLLFEFTYRNQIKPIEETKDLLDEMGKFLYTVVNADNQNINNVKLGRKIYFNYNTNKFRIGTLNISNKLILAENDFIGSKIELKSELANNKNLLVGIADKLEFTNKDLDTGLFIKLIDSTNFNSLDTPTTATAVEQNLSINDFTSTPGINIEITLPTKKNDLTKEEFANKLFSFKGNDTFEKVNLLKPDQTTFLLAKNYEKSYTLEVPTDGILMLVDPGRYLEYPINLTKHAIDKDEIQINIANRAGKKLYNNGQAPRKGQFNGWKLAKQIRNYISYNLYDKKYDFDISTQSLEYFWVTIYQPISTAQTFNLNITGHTFSINTSTNIGKYTIWYSPSKTDNPTTTQFNLIPASTTFIKIANTAINYVSFININTIDNECELYIESYGYSTSTYNFNVALTSIRDDMIIPAQQLCLDNHVVYDLLVTKFAQSDSCYPMDTNTDTNRNLTMGLSNVNNVLNNTTSEFNTSEFNTSEFNTSELNISELNISNANTTELNISNANTTELNTSNANTTELNTSNASTTELNTSNASTTELNTSNASTSELNISNANTTELNTSNASTPELNTSNASTPELNTSNAINIRVQNIESTISNTPIHCTSYENTSESITSKSKLSNVIMSNNSSNISNEYYIDDYNDENLSDYNIDDNIISDNVYDNHTEQSVFLTNIYDNSTESKKYYNPMHANAKNITTRNITNNSTEQNIFLTNIYDNSTESKKYYNPMHANAQNITSQNIISQNITSQNIISRNIISRNIISRSITNNSTGWYFNSAKNFNIKLLSDDDIKSSNDNIDITYKNFHTLFIEVIIKESANFSLSGFSNTINISGTGKKIIYIKNSPFTTELDVTVDPPTVSTGMSLSIPVPSRTDTYYQNIEAGKHEYTVTFYTEYGETTRSNIVTTDPVVPFGNGRVLISNIPVSTNKFVIGRNIYRTKSNGTIFYLLHSFNDNTSTVFLDLIPDNLLGKELPTINSTVKSFPLPYFSYLDTFTYLDPNITGVLLKFEDSISPILPEQKIGEFLVNVGNLTNIEIISYGYKILGKPPVHLMTRWTSIENDALVHNVDGFLTIQKDISTITDSVDISYESKFKVKAYGDFFTGNYKQFGNTYGDIRTNVTVNLYAIKNALFILDSSEISNYTIKTDGLKYQTKGVGIIKSDGTISTSNVLLDKFKYIIANFSFNSSNYNESTYIDIINGQPVFTKNGGITFVLLQGIYAALFKEFNKSASILNTSLLASLGQIATEVNKPNIPFVNYSESNASNLIPGAIYSYKVTYYTNNGETESSVASTDIMQKKDQPKKLIVSLPKSTDNKVIGRKIYRRTLGKLNDTYNYIEIIENNTDETYLDDTVEPTITTVAPPNLAFLTTNESGYNTINVARLLSDSDSSLTGGASYVYAYSYFKQTITGILETEKSAYSSPIIIPINPCKVILNMPISSSDEVTGRYIYRSLTNQLNFRLLATVPNNTSTVFIDNIADSALQTKTPINPSTFANVPTPELSAIGDIFFARLYYASISQILLLNTIYKYKFTYVVNSSASGILGETEPSPETTGVTQPFNIAYKILINLPISPHASVIRRNIYRTESNGTVYKFLGSVNDNFTSLYIDNMKDSDLGIPLSLLNTAKLIAPEINTTSALFGNVDSIDNIISDIITEEDVPVVNSKLFKMYVASGRYSKDESLYGQPNENIKMNLENMEINIKCRLRGAIYNINNSAGINKQAAELIFGKFEIIDKISNVGGESDTLVREVIRISNSKLGTDTLGNKLDMLNNETNQDGTYKILTEMQYIIDFIISFNQRAVT